MCLQNSVFFNTKRKLNILWCYEKSDVKFSFLDGRWGGGEFYSIYCFQDEDQKSPRKNKNCLYFQFSSGNPSMPLIFSARHSQVVLDMRVLHILFIAIVKFMLWKLSSQHD